MIKIWTISQLSEGVWVQAHFQLLSDFSFPTTVAFLSQACQAPKTDPTNTGPRPSLLVPGS